MHTWWKGIFLFSLTAASTGFAQSSLYLQYTDDPEGKPSDGRELQFWGKRVADNFNVGSVTVTQVRWWGGSENAFFPDLTNFSDWRIVFYENNASNLPGVKIYDHVFPLNVTSPSPTGMFNMSGGIEYEQIVTLPTPLDLATGEYWIAIGSFNIERLDDCWLWSADVDEGDGGSATETWGGSPYSHQKGDFAFELLGTGSGCPLAGCELGDFDHDCAIGISDLAHVLANFSLSPADPEDGDLNNDNIVDIQDIAQMLSLFGTVCQ